MAAAIAHDNSAKTVVSPSATFMLVHTLTTILPSFSFCLWCSSTTHDAQACLSATHAAVSSTLSCMEMTMHWLLVQSQILVHQLTDYLDNFAGDQLAEVPDQARSSGPFSGLAGPISGFAAAVLKFKLDSPACIKVLRRLLAALLPDNSAGQYFPCDNTAPLSFVLCHAVLVCAVPCRGELCCVAPCRALPCRAALRCAVLCCAVRRSAMSGRAMPCHAML